jgi:O-antigen ligase/tetratricopeptide (TPR) repeat protein
MEKSMSLRAERTMFSALAVLVVAAPLCIGGAHPQTQLALSAATWVIAGAYLLGMRRSKPLRAGFLVLLGAAALVWTLVQLVPLPARLLGWLSPHALSVRREVSPALGFAPITLDPAATLIEVVKLLGLFGLFACVTNFTRTQRRASALLLVVAATGGALALVAWVQRAAGVTRILCVYAPAGPLPNGFIGTFVAANHAASFFSLTALVGAGLALELRGRKRTLAVSCALLAATVVGLSRSRAGSLALALGALLLFASAMARRLGRGRGALLALILVGLASGLMLTVSDGLRERIVRMDGLHAWADNQKTRGWRDTLALIGHHPLTGVGRGAFEAPLREFRSAGEGVRLVHPENLPLQIASEWGVPAALAFIALFALWAVRARAALADSGLALVGAAAGLSAVLLHELADFSLEMAGVAVPFVVVLGVVAARTLEHGAGRGKLPRVPRPLAASVLALWPLALAGGWWGVNHSLDADTRRAEEAVRGQAPDAEQILAAARLRHPADDHFDLLAARLALARREGAPLRHLNRALQRNPSNWQAHYLAARYLAATGHPTQAALEYRAAVTCGLSNPPWDEIIRLLGPAHLRLAVPQRAESVMNVAQILAGKAFHDEAEAAADVAVELGEAQARWRLARLEVVARGARPERVRVAAEALLGDEDDAQHVVRAAQALAAVGLLDEAAGAIERGIRRHPHAGALYLQGARIQLAKGSPVAAQRQLQAMGRQPVALASRQEAEELLAQIADGLGDHEAALVARARARQLAKQRQLVP